MKKTTICLVLSALFTSAIPITSAANEKPSPKLAPETPSSDLAKDTVGMVRPDAERLKFDDLKSLHDSLVEVMKGFLSPEQLTDLSKGINRSGTSKLTTSGAWILKNYAEQKARPSFDELKFRQNVLIETARSYGIELAPVEIAPVVQSVAFQPAYLLAALPLAALGGGGGGGGGGSSLTAADYETTEYSAQYGLGSISASTAYARGYTGSGVTVSVLDSPFDTDHPDLTGKFATGYNASTGGTDVTCTPGSCTSTHGTFVSGIIAASKNSSGMHGVAYGATVKPVTVFDSSGTWNVTTAQLANAIAAGSGAGIAVMNNSWGTSTTASTVIGGVTYYYRRPSHSTFAAAVNSAAEAAVANTVVVFANGNDGHNSATGRVNLYNSSANALAGGATGYQGYASTTTNLASGEGRQPLINSNLSGAWLTVVALDSSNVIATYSNGCGDAKAFCIAAPGSAIYSTVDLDYSGSGYSPSGGFGTADGTSFAAPHVSGALAILKQQFPNLTPSQLVSLLISTATDLGASGVDEVYGVGMLNLSAATTPQGVLRIASGDALANDLYTTQNTGMRLSRVFGSSLAGLKVGILDGYNRSYEWTPTLSKPTPIEFKPSAYFGEASSAKQVLMSTPKVQLTGDLTGADSGATLNGSTLSWTSSESRVKLGYSRLQQRPPGWSSNNNAGPSELFAFQVAPGLSDLTSAHGERALAKDLNLFVSTTTGRYEGAGAFTESAYGFHYSSASSHLSLRAGLLNEHEQFLGSTGYGAYSPSRPARTSFWSLGGAVKVGNDVTVAGRYSAARTSVGFQYQELASASSIATDEFQVSLTKSGLLTPKGTVSLNVQAPLAVRAGQFNQTTTIGYSESGNYRSVTQMYDLASSNREQIISLVFREPGKQSQSYAGLFARWNADGISGASDIGIRLGYTSRF